MTCYIVRLLFMVSSVGFITKCNAEGPVRINHNVQVTGDFVKLPIFKISLEQCAHECRERSRCSGINYRKRYLLCEVLYRHNVNNSVSDEAIGYVHASREDILGQNTDSDPCPDCEDCVCNSTSGECEYEECRDYIVPGSVVYGNKKTVGAKVKVDCHSHLVMVNGIATSYCQANGTWSSSPNCYWDCGDPHPETNAIVQPGGTLNGTVRIHECVNDFFLSGNRLVTATNVTCPYGGHWPRGPRCVKDCNPPPAPEHRFAETLTNGGVRDHAQRSYTCAPGHVIVETGNYWDLLGVIAVKNRKLSGRSRRIQCNGLHPAWKDLNFWCVPECSNAPELRNVRNVTHTYNHNITTTTAIYKCSYGHVVYKDDVITGLTSFRSKCNVSDGIWTNSNWKCLKDCNQRPHDTNAEVSVIVSLEPYIPWTKFDKSSTTLQYACAPDHVVFRNNTFSTETSFQSLCKEANGNWTNEDHVCAKDCRNPPNITNIQEITFSHTTSSTKMTYTCASDHVVMMGDQLSNENTFISKCVIPDGEWTHSDYFCIRACNNMPQPDNVVLVSYSDEASTSVLVYACAPGHVVYRNNTITDETGFESECSQPIEDPNNSDLLVGDWTHSNETCVKGCVRWPDRTNVQDVYHSHNDVASVMTYNCSADHVVLQGSVLTNETTFESECSSPNGYSTNFNWKCIKACSNPPEPDNIQNREYSYAYNVTSVEYACADGHVVFNDNNLTAATSFISTCDPYENIQRWTHSTATCVKGCTNKPDPFNVENTTYTFTSDVTTILYACAPGHVIFRNGAFTNDTSNESECDTPNGLWTFPDLTCALECVNPPNLTNIATVVKTPYQSKTDAVFHCATGYVIFENNELTTRTRTTGTCLTPGGSWDFVHFLCVPDCGRLVPFTNAVLKVIEASYTAVKAQYECNVADPAKEAISKCNGPGENWIRTNTCPTSQYNGLDS